MSKDTIRILSTKKLTPSQKELLLNAGIAITDVDFIEITPLEFNIKQPVENAIFTSKNAVKAVVDKNIVIKNCFCVGDKTSELISEQGWKVLESAYQADKLAEKIIQSHADKNFVFFCTQRRREELPEMLQRNKIGFTEIETYNSNLKPQLVTTGFDGILFFSPSAVESFAQNNLFEDFTAFSIGKTTEKALKKHTNNIITANKTTIENVIVQAIKYYST
ncbi:uroporphyrinogen-III synthase [Robertkochia solimangrovi]|uniref:uroporphyrinogen-III synthase n=1 Tax=Robertkochia solimangrovi TaxID=2213046 RepID=UPI001180EB60|nr:uroporphyrinogen-III synthase [Robertkochia solimangrovi]TRZ45953.1 uroporphyrinogen-III synthase [Robertkochia solimangrovi]